jgi:hypothetical protein
MQRWNTVPLAILSPAPQKARKAGDKIASGTFQRSAEN